ncbi:MAG: NAD(P)/FAD-dependent oxidoreductase [Solirubrobacteraceae bacterium]|nr:NAD(P)/FAD-dependent oxidoreductase [Solirubrobacteraceae bacterium]
MSQPEHLDVLIVGAGLSGIGAAYHLQKSHPGRSYAILEARDTLGGTWELFKYPGIRSDSDMSTLGFPFRPWTETASLADGPAILEYLRDTAVEYGIDQKIRYDRKVLGASFSTADGLWTVDIETPSTGERSQITCNFYLSCTGYYRYDEGFTPEFKGRERFKGQIVHPQHWPEDLDYKGKRVIVIGSGATAVTLVPAMADDTAHITMLQRTPTWVAPIPSVDKIAERLSAVLPDRLAFGAVRWKNILRQIAIYQLSRKRPSVLSDFIHKQQKRMLPDGYDIATHFTPPYNPWDQRLCAVPSGDLFRSIKKGDASVVTDHIDTFTEKGILLKSGQELEADIIITATGLNLLLLGGIPFTVDGEQVDPSDRVVYKGMMLSGVPNMAFAIGYTNSSWTLKADLTGDYVGRLLSHLDKTGNKICVPQVDDSVERRPFLDFGAGYVLRSLDNLPSQGSQQPWSLRQNFLLDLPMLKFAKVDDGVMEFSVPSGKKAAGPGKPAEAVSAA